VKVDTAGLEILDRKECLRLLCTASVGRIGFTYGALPTIQPVNFVVYCGSLIIRIGAGTKLATATRHAVVAFQADEFDLNMRTGWSVTAVGHARAVRDQSELEILRALPLSSWIHGESDHYVRIGTEVLSGRRITDTAAVLGGPR
jgi:nitroimidazol reductase NimA-like FMN-containing flavoprotein (pyridoxamine 5'-phosphate oxidase superfamily)